MKRRLALLLLIVLPAAGALAGGQEYVRLPGGPFRTALKYEDSKNGVRVAPFEMMRKPVTNGQFLAFVQTHPQWQRENIARAFADDRYLEHWRAANVLVDHTQESQPVTQVSWFAAQAYCEAQQARLPTWSEWEFAAAADETRRDARQDPAWRERILSWYSRPSSGPLPRAGLQAPNAYGVQDLHGLVWEWTDDFSALLVSGDNRNQGDPDKSLYCGAGGLSMDDTENFAVLMRVAMLSSLEANSTTRNLGFRCARNVR
jgi:formylglycine-generating enzyme required for sulfatase activity